jgi:type IX secretion system PorP/SprF family membrane protein
MKKTLLLTFFLACYCMTTKAQEGIPVYFDYLSDNYYLVYPSMAGISPGGKIRGTYRKQWFDVEDAPNLQTLSAHMRVGEKSGVGAILFNDANGYHSQGGVKLTYAYHLKLGGDFRSLNQLSFGLSGVFLQNKLDESQFRSVTPDPLLTGGSVSAAYYNVDFGMSYNVMEFYAHAAVLNVLGRRSEIYELEDQFIDNARRYLVSIGYVFGRSEWKIEPSLLYQVTDFTQEKSIDINAKVYRDLDFGTLWGGVSYRRSFDGAQYQTNGSFGEQRLQLFTPIVGVNFNNFMVSYNYSYQTGDIRLDDGGFHQITIGYDFGQEGRGSRYDCYCPATNY